MRIIAGTAKGIRLARVPKGVRPLSDIAREGLFSSLGDAAGGARVLDLYAGTGAMGIEALSRGAEHAVFVERSRAAVRAIKENLARTGLASRATVVAADAGRFVTAGDTSLGPFGLVLLDPPYEAGPAELEPVLAALAARWLPSHRWAVVLTRRSGSSTPVVPVHWLVARCLEYGDTLVLVFREA